MFLFRAFEKFAGAGVQNLRGALGFLFGRCGRKTQAENAVRRDFIVSAGENDMRITGFFVGRTCGAGAYNQTSIVGEMQKNFAAESAGGNR